MNISPNKDLIIKTKKLLCDNLSQEDTDEFILQFMLVLANLAMDVITCGGRTTGDREYEYFLYILEDFKKQIPEMIEMKMKYH